MAKLYYMGLEPYEGRYTLQLQQWSEAAFKRRGIDYEVIHGDILDNSKAIVTGQVLDAHGRGYYSLTQIMDQTLGFSPPGGPAHEVPLFRHRLYGPPGYAGPVNAGPSYDPVDYLETFYARPHSHAAGSAPTNLIYKQSPAVDSIHNGRIPLRQQPGFELQHNYMSTGNPQPMNMSVNMFATNPALHLGNASQITEVD